MRSRRAEAPITQETPYPISPTAPSASAARSPASNARPRDKASGSVRRTALRRSPPRPPGYRSRHSFDCCPLEAGSVGRPDRHVSSLRWPPEPSLRGLLPQRSVAACDTTWGSGHRGDPKSRFRTSRLVSGPRSRGCSSPPARHKSPRPPTPAQHRTPRRQVTAQRS